jgi:DNA-binding SARP family transcriptional activator
MRNVGHNQRVDVRVRLAGGFTVARGSRDLAPAELGSRRGRLLLALLAAARPSLVTVDALAEVLWPDEVRRRAAADVATLVSRLRRVLGRAAVEGDRQGYRLGGGVVVDMDEATALLVDAADEAEAPALRSAAARRALELVGDTPPLPEAGSWADPVRAEWARIRRDALHMRSTAAAAAGEYGVAVEAARTALAADPLDEQAARDVMSAHQGSGQIAAALEAYEELRERLRDELGADPSGATQRVHLALLRDEQVSAGAPPPSPSRPANPNLVGRDDELYRLRRLWSAAVAGQPGIVLVVGESGIGKTALNSALADLVTRTGGTVVSARCYDTERSLLLQPFVDVVRTALTALPQPVIAEIAGEHAGALLTVLPDLGPILGDPPRVNAAPELLRRRTFDAVAGTLSRLGRRAPLLINLDDLQDAGRSTVELLHYLARRAGRTALLVTATLQPDRGASALATLRDVAHVVRLGPLQYSDVVVLATRLGRPELAEALMRRTAGHPLFVVESLRALSTGSAELPDSLREAVLARVRRLPEPGETVLRAAAVFESGVALADLTPTAGLPQGVVETACERALEAGLLAVTGRDYEFAHDLARKVLYLSTPEPTRVALHRRAADQLSHRPEALARQAQAAGELARAARAWLIAGERAMRGYLVSDAERMADDALAVATEAGQRELAARALVLRGRARHAAADNSEAAADLESAIEVAREIGDRRLELTTISQLAPTAFGLPADEAEGYINRGLALCRELGDHIAEIYTLGRLSVLKSNRLQFVEAVDLAQHSAAAARATGDEEVLAAALDSLKTSWAYLGEVDQLRPIVEELDAILRRRGDLWFLQWTAFEAAFAPLASGDFDAAMTQIERAHDVNRRSGFLSYEPWFTAHLGWVSRLAGDLTTARTVGRQAWEHSIQVAHPWWRATAAGFYAATLLQMGDRAEAVTVLERVRAEVVVRRTVEAHLLRWLSPLAEATGDLSVIRQADAMLATAAAPAGSAWVLGADVYLCLARAWYSAGQPRRAERVLAPLLVAVRRIPWVPVLAEIERLQTVHA